ncbi:LysR substrate-binding domain-containing protein [Nitratireductor soli]|uniref:LysR substrate-binding domain-containing protein n=1 Tax=Nitratireductor soli TaxID=1670619 RepID=UPI00065DF892|nr:LysR substrate-binding domain-containing protein [Nitratireductor soli]
MRFDDLALFVAAVDRGGFSAAARALGLPRSTVSKRVAELERSIGALLIQRTTRRFQLTHAGEQFYRHAAAAMLEAAAAQEAVENLRTEPAGLVTISASWTSMTIGLSKVLNEVAAHHPKLRLKISLTNRFVDLVGEGVDIALRAHQDELADSDLVQRRIGFTRNYVVASPEYLATSDTPGHPDELMQHAIIHGDTHVDRPVWSFRTPLLSVRLNTRIVVDDPLHALSAALSGLGIANLPEVLCRSALNRGNLMRLLPEWDAGGAHLSLLTPTRRGQLPSIRAVADAIASGLVAAGEGPNLH